jgi:hypothetical protein
MVIRHSGEGRNLRLIKLLKRIQSGFRPKFTPAKAGAGMTAPQQPQMIMILICN